MNHHDILINRAMQDGWARGHGWRVGFDKHVQQCGPSLTEWAEIQESLDMIAVPRPDAWRIVVEGPEGVWTRPIHILEFLEVEVTSGIDAEKDDLYRYVWDMFDATMHYHLRIWHMDRFGVVRPYITNSTQDPLVFGMDAGRRA